MNKAKIQSDMTIRQIGKIGLWVVPVGGYLFLWIPIIVLIVFSFNDSESVSVWQGFTTRWYVNIFSNAISAGTESARFSTELMLNAVKNTLIVSISATIVSTVIGTMVSLSLARGNYPGKKLLDSLLYLPVVIPEITQGISLAVFFKILFDFINDRTGVQGTTGFGTIIIAHAVFNISYVAIVVRARLADMNPRLEEAARDLGANEWKTFWRVTWPLILPGVVAGALLAFTLSLDDFVATFFTSGVGTTTLPVFVYGMIKQRIPPEINALSTLMLLASTILVAISLGIQGRNNARG
ncbi:MAG: ABC transporter permease [Burkholderiales bacterium]|nr:ABC transporter permease [Anaerolineae bacterium]